MRSILNAGGRLVLLSNRIVPQSPTSVDLDERIGHGGVDAINDALAVVCTPA